MEEGMYMQWKQHLHSYKVEPHNLKAAKTFYIHGGGEKKNNKKTEKSGLNFVDLNKCADVSCIFIPFTKQTWVFVAAYKLILVPFFWFVLKMFILFICMHLTALSLCKVQAHVSKGTPVKILPRPAVFNVNWAKNLPFFLLCIDFCKYCTCTGYLFRHL